MSVCLSLCGGACVGVEGCGMHQNMCLLAALMSRRSQERLSLPLSLRLSLPSRPCLPISRPLASGPSHCSLL